MVFEYACFCKHVQVLLESYTQISPMTKIKSFVFILVALFVFESSSFAQSDSNNEKSNGIQFEHSTWEDILSKAKKGNKLIFIDAYTTWCGPCKMMAKNVFTDTEVGAFFNQNFINVKLDMEKEPGLSLKSKLNVTAYPTLIFVDSNVNIEHKAVGALPKTEFLKFGNQVLGSAMKLSDYNEAYQKDGVSNFKFLVGYLKMLKSAGENAKLKQVVITYFDKLESAKLLEQENWELFKEYIHTTENKAFLYLLNNREKFETTYDVKEVQEKIYYTCLRQGNQLCDKQESGKYTLKTERKIQFIALLEKYQIKDRAKIIAYSNISTARSLGDWKTFVNHISTNLKSGLIDRSVMSLYNYALPINRATQDKELRKEAAKWCDMGLATENLDAGFKNAFVKLKADLLK